MTYPTNDDRAEYAHAALEAFQERTRTNDEDGDTILRDLLTDLRHWADREGVDFDRELSASLDHFNEEKAEEEEGEEE